ncbi:MAG: glycoside hydrolase family 20 zincin-like fold domain-containing protein, partial [Armatimonadota bacterium]|nr:glycoside hydrolase family 20 zincin-like fold domain-containing protein [Armatimonadota bacterium]
MSDAPVLFPMPRVVNPAAGRFAVRPTMRLDFTFDESPLLRHAAADLNQRLQELGGFRLAPLYGVLQPGSICFERRDGLGEEGYSLHISADGIRAAAETPAGAFYAAQTLRQCLTAADGQVFVPALHIADSPDFAHRGVFVENKWGMDRMTLDDWRACIDELSRLKLNLLGVGAYGCWCIQYEGQVTEFLTLPVPEYPLLRTEKTVRYYSPREGWRHLTYLPRLFEEDFFGQVVAYGRERNVVVRPHFNSLGHNTLIPRLYPEVSALDAHGEPTGYGYCLTNPAT